MHPKINRVGDGQKAKQTNKLKWLTFATLPRFAYILPHNESIVAAMCDPRQDADRTRQVLLKSSASTMNGLSASRDRWVPRSFAFFCEGYVSKRSVTPSKQFRAGLKTLSFSV